MLTELEGVEAVHLISDEGVVVNNPSLSNALIEQSRGRRRRYNTWYTTTEFPLSFLNSTLYAGGFTSDNHLDFLYSWDIMGSIHPPLEDIINSNLTSHWIR